MNYYIADTHFGHANIIRFDHRPFADTYQMEEVMQMLWNAAVRKDDWVYILGDFCWDKSDEWLRIIRKLNGRKVLIQGNHDLTSYPAELKKEFADICDFKEIVDVGKDGNTRKVLLSHYPMPFYKHSCNPKYVMLCGHVHNTAENELLEKWTRELRNYNRNNAFGFQPCGQIYNVGAMMPWMEYTPRTLDEIVKRWDKWHQEDSV